MANNLYTKAKEAILSGGINLLNDTIKAVAVDSADYTVALATHQYLADIPAAARVATTEALSGKSVANGVFTASNSTLASATGDTFEAIVVYKDTGDAATSLLICYLDTATSGLPFTPDGGNIELRWAPAGSYGIFRI